MECVVNIPALLLLMDDNPSLSLGGQLDVKEAVELLFGKPAFCDPASGVSHALLFPKSWVLGLDVNYVPKSVKPARKVGLWNWVLCQFLSFFFMATFLPFKGCFGFLKKINAYLQF